jgi:hypothetical protein
MREYITLQEAAGLVPTKTAITTVWRWCRWGLTPFRGEQVVKMRFARVGRRLMTTKEWVEQLFTDLADAENQATERIRLRPGQMTAARRRQIEEAEEILRRAGI